MVQTAEGGKNFKQRMLEKFGSEEAFKEHMRSLASKGGKKTSGYKFGHGKVDPSKIGAIGGTISRRKPSVK